MSDKQNEMRDARLKKALDSAPDEGLRPGHAVREAILNKARLSAAAAAPRRESLRWWSFSRPWNSGLATVGLVAFVGVLIWNQDLLKQSQELQQPRSEAAAPVPEANAVTAPLPQVAMTPPVPEKKTLAAPVRKAEAPPQSNQTVTAEAAPTPIMASRRQEAQDKAAAFASTSVPPPPSPVAAAPAAAPVEMPKPVPVPPPAPAPMIVAPMPMPAPVAQAARSGAPLERIDARGSAVAVAVAVSSWTALRIATPNGPVLIARESLPLATQALVQQQLSRPPSEASSNLRVNLARTPGLQVDLLAGERSVGRLSLGAGELRQQLEAALKEAPR